METTQKREAITVKTSVDAPIEKVWNAWTDPQQITKWNNASDDWHTPYAENDIRTGGKFMSRMAAKDGSMSFDFGGTYKNVENHKVIEYAMEDGRKVKVTFEKDGNKTSVTETFDPESQNSIEMQRGGWQAILDNFKKHVENPAKGDKMHFEIKINAPTDKVYNTMLDQKGYSAWTKAFNGSSRYEGKWEKGAKIKFIGEQDGKEGGMVSRIKDIIPNKFVSIEHLGMLDGDKEIMDTEEVKKWAGMLENYTFLKDGDKTRLIVEMDSIEEMASYFEETWPKALDLLKKLCEN